MALSRRSHLVNTALTLFYQNGFHATGIDTILAEAGVAKMTLYKHFKSKDELILAALRRSHEHWRNWFMRAAESGDSPRGKLLAVFDALEGWFTGPGFYGCLFINACAEYTRQDHPIHKAGAEHKALVLDYLSALTAATEAKDPEALARRLSLLIEGATVTAHVSGDTAAARHARAAAEALLHDAGVN